MGIKQTLQTYFNNHCETSETHNDEQLRSHYYKLATKKAMKSVKEIIEKLDGFRVTSFSDEHGEISVSVAKGKKAFMVVTVISVRPFETAIDFSVTTNTKILPFDFGFSRKVVLYMYETLDKELTFIGTGLNG